MGHASPQLFAVNLGARGRDADDSALQCAEPCAFLKRQPSSSVEEKLK